MRHLHFTLSCVHHVVTQIAAQTFVQEKEYGLALSYSSSAEDWTGLGRVVDRVLQEYITAGMNNCESSFSELNEYRQGRNNSPVM